ncbi:3D domain-containing protein [Bdellovibrio bacteriovorus]|uniref:3D domain-containing protein n=1 Tax=Bdellovibrio bacteriovorus (strain ATCC 15356 / DSM 50701 / NCIMB 9529 / HD100) TaxID=264462 RepID=Q6MQ82_BDEBA|nr:3D domain-containing protein [Bdellovibrio bacteriovorus]CAE78565.1 hypothetical protein predicted by Glimmer/Critica [Bdellovibrio bacteriovorus HD100]
MKIFSQILALLGAVLLLNACAASKSSEGSGLTPTIYYKPTIQLDKNKCSSASLRDLLSPEGRVLTTLCDSDYAQCLLQGSCLIDDQGLLTSYNYHSTKDGLARFIVTDTKACPFGYGVSNACLDPYFSAAADLKIYKLGDVIYIPRLVGAKMPNGEVHDGYIVIRDAGGGVKGAGRFDFFTGYLDHRNKKNTMARLGFGDPKNRIEYRVVRGEEAARARERRGFPGLKKSILEEQQE